LPSTRIGTIINVLPVWGIPMAVHDLVITTRVENLEPGEKLLQYIQENEIVSGGGFTLHLNIENIGTEKFPGGKIARIFLTSSVTEYHWPTDVNIPEIAPNESKHVSQILGIVAEPGVYSFRWRIEPSDTREMLYRRGRDSEEMKEDYISPFLTMVDRHQLEIISLLHKIVDRLPKE